MELQPEQGLYPSCTSIRGKHVDLKLYFLKIKVGITIMKYTGYSLCNFLCRIQISNLSYICQYRNETKSSANIGALYR